MDFVRYAEASARLVNADPASLDALVATLDGREWLHPQVTERDVTSVRRFLRGLRPVFDAADAGDRPVWLVQSGRPPELVESG